MRNKVRLKNCDLEATYNQENYEPDINLNYTFYMSYYQCHDCMKIVHFDADNRDTCPACGSKNGEVTTDEDHKRAIEEGYLFYHDDTD